MPIAYFDCSSGVAGDMMLGSFVDAGMSLRFLRQELRKLPVRGYTIVRDQSSRALRGTNLHVNIDHELSPQPLSSLEKLLQRSTLKKKVKERSLHVFERLARAEARVLGKRLSSVRLYSTGALDLIIDVIGAAIGFEYFDFDAVFASPLPFSRKHVPPLSMELLKGIPVEPAPFPAEMVTPTGIALLSAVVSHFGESPLQTIDALGIGFGDRLFPHHHNILRLMIGDGYPVVIIEATIDDMNPQVYDYLFERLFEAGAVDVLLASVQAKKNRPAVLLSCQAPWHKKNALCDLLLKETTTFGVRYFPVERRICIRELRMVKTKWGNVRMKVGFDANGTIVKRIPEYEDMKRLARKTQRPLLTIYQEVLCTR